MVRSIVFIFLAVMLLSACSPAGTDQPDAGKQEKPLVTVYREPT